jgi:aldehyde dehydrogenase (NAD+)
MTSPLTSRLQAQQQYFASGATRTYAFRREQLLKLRTAVLAHEKDLHNALYADLRKSPEESWVTETGFLLSELNATLKRLRQWMQPDKVSTNLVNLPSSSFIIREPLGVVLIISPWNYPFQLLFTPLVGAMAAGNCAVLKPSEFAPATAAVIEKIVRETFPPEYILCVTGDGAEVIPAMMEHFRFNHVFYTGSTSVGRLIYKMAADQLVPVTLELGGKSPCVVESDANIKVAARRIAATKFSNAGQMCVAPDYVLVHASKKEALLQSLTESLRKFFGNNASDSYSYGKIINQKQFDRLVSYLQQGRIVHGGKHDASKLYIEPTIMEDPQSGSAVMQEEIFGPILPVIAFNTMEEARTIINQHPDPLAFYVFTSSKEKEKAWIEQVPFGGGCVNNASWHLTNHNLPFGGRGNSGLGNYHGRHSFDVFSHQKSILKTPTWFDPDIKYPPYNGKLGLFRKVIK